MQPDKPGKSLPLCSLTWRPQARSTSEPLSLSLPAFELGKETNLSCPYCLNLPRLPGGRYFKDAEVQRGKVASLRPHSWKNGSTELSLGPPGSQTKPILLQTLLSMERAVGRHTPWVLAPIDWRARCKPPRPSAILPLEAPRPLE